MKKACRFCRYQHLDEPEADGETRAPRPGEPILCCRCCAIHTVDADGSFRGFTPEELAEFRDALHTQPGLIEEMDREIEALIFNSLKRRAMRHAMN